MVSLYVVVVAMVLSARQMIIVPLSIDVTHPVVTIGISPPGVEIVTTFIEILVLRRNCRVTTIWIMLIIVDSDMVYPVLVLVDFSGRVTPGSEIFWMCKLIVSIVFYYPIMKLHGNVVVMYYLYRIVSYIENKKVGRYIPYFI